MVQGLCIETPTLEALRTANLSAYDQAIVSAIFNLLPQGIPPGGVSYDLLARFYCALHSFRGTFRLTQRYFVIMFWV